MVQGFWLLLGSEDDVLGIDRYKYLDNKDMKDLRFTNRGIIKTIRKKIYGPLGLISKFTVRAKILLQDIWTKTFILNKMCKRIY